MSDSATSSANPTGRPCHDITLVKGGRLYRFVACEETDETALLDEAIRLAQDAGSDIDWFDAALIAHEMGRRLTSHLHEHSARGGT